jgi:RNA polymerase sigma factor (sigma-70 family)
MHRHTLGVTCIPFQHDAFASTRTWHVQEPRRRAKGVAVGAAVSERSDSELMAAYAKGDQAAFAELFSRHAASVFRVVRQSLDSDADAHDLVQRAFLQLHRARFDFDDTKPLKPFLYTIVFNLKREHYRRAHRKPTEVLTREPAAEQAPPTQRRERVEQASAVRDAINQLPAGQREVIELHWFNELSFPEIAHVVGAKLSAVKVRAHRGYATLRSILQPDGNAGGER